MRAQADVCDVMGRPVNTPWRITTPNTVREGVGAGSIVTRRWRPIQPLDGKIDVELEPGLAIIEFDGTQWLVDIPDEDGDLWDIISTAVAFPPDTSQDALAAAVDSYLQENPPSGDIEVDNISDAGPVGADVIKAQTKTQARDAIGAGTSNLTLGSTGSTAKPGNYQPTTADISDATSMGQTVLTGTAEQARSALEAVGQPDLWWSAKRHGVPQAGRRKRGGSITSGQSTLTLTGAVFTTGDLIVVRGAGASGAPLVATVSTGGTGTCTLTEPAAATVVNAVVDWGPDETTAINDFFAAIVAAGAIDQQISTLPGTGMHPVYPTAFFPDGGISLVSGTITKPQGVGVVFGCNAWIRAAAIIAGPVLATEVTALIQHETWQGIGVDANQVADNNLYLPYFAGLSLPNARLGGAKKIGVVAGDPGAANSSYELKMPNIDMRRDKGDAVPAGSFGLWTQRCTDSKFDGIICGYDVNVFNASANNDFDVHAWNYRDNVSTIIFYDTATTARYHAGCTADSPRPVTHTASANSGTSTITDASILAFHAGLPVSGTGIPANTYIGSVTPGVSFTLANAPVGGSAVNTTGTVTAVTIAGAGWVVAGTGTTIRGYALNTIEDSASLAAVVITAPTTPLGLIDIDVRGTTGCIWSNDVLGDQRGILSLQTRCSNVTTVTQSQLVQDTGKVALLLRNASGGNADIMRHVNSGNSAVLAGLDTAGVWRGLNFTATRATPTYGTTVSLDYKGGRWQTITATNATGFTINNPSNSPSSSQTGELTIEVANTSGGALGTVTWGSAYKFAGLAWTSPATGKSRYAKFQWNGSWWVCVSIAAADY